LTISEFKHLQGHLMLNYKTLKHQIRFEGLSRASKNGKFFFKNFQGRVATLNEMLNKVPSSLGSSVQLQQQPVTEMKATWWQFGS